MSGFGQCRACGNGVERVGWDDLCFACQEAEHSEYADDDDGFDYGEEDRFLYSVPFTVRPVSEEPA